MSPRTGLKSDTALVGKLQGDALAMFQNTGTKYHKHGFVKLAALKDNFAAESNLALAREMFAFFKGLEQGDKSPLVYERELRHRRLWDATDREVALIQRILEEGFVATTPLESSKRDGGAMAILDHVYCDEVQDMTQATLAVLLLAVGNRPERLFVCGDTAQAIQDGVAFRFSDLKETIYELQKEVKTRSGRGAAAMAAAMHARGDLRSASSFPRTAAETDEPLLDPRTARARAAPSAATSS